MLKNFSLNKLLLTCKSKITCCRGTSKEHFEAKLPDIVSYINHNLRSFDRLLHISDSDIELWSIATNSKLGKLNFNVKDKSVFITFISLEGGKLLLGNFDPKFASKSIARMFLPHLSTL